MEELCNIYIYIVISKGHVIVENRHIDQQIFI